MNKVNMLTVLTAVALLSLAPGLDAAPLMSREPDAFEEAADGVVKPTDVKMAKDNQTISARDLLLVLCCPHFSCIQKPQICHDTLSFRTLPPAKTDSVISNNKKPPDPWKTVTDEEDITARATKILDKLLRRGSKTTFPDGDGKTVRVLDLEIIKATSNPNVKDINNPLKTLTDRSDGREEIPPASDRRDGSTTTSSPHSPQQTEENGLSEVIDSSERRDTLPAPKLDDVSGASGPREELVKMLSALEEFHKLVNSTLSHRITIIPRGNGNGRNPAKKNKMVVTEGNLKSTTATTVISGATSAKTGTDHTDPKLSKKTFKTSLSSAPKKPNKRVCFWKYCSQN